MTISFNSLGLSEDRVNKLETLGFTSPTEIQTKAIPLILEGHDILGQSQTGTGKTHTHVNANIHTQTHMCDSCLACAGSQQTNQTLKKIKTKKKKINIIIQCNY
jgi:superfamily II DNA/RNA helicase